MSEVPSSRETDERRARRITMLLYSGEIVRYQGQLVCSYCMGNCGQCGLTDVIGNLPASLDAVIVRLATASSLHAMSKTFAAPYGKKQNIFKRIVKGVKSWLSR